MLLSHPLSETAAEWYIRCTDDELTIDERKRLRSWLQASPKHRKELLAISDIDCSLLHEFNPEHARSRGRSAAVALLRAFDIPPAELKRKVDRFAEDVRTEGDSALPTVPELHEAGVSRRVILAAVLGTLFLTQAQDDAVASASSALIVAGEAGLSIVIPQASTPNGVIVLTDTVAFTRVVNEIERNPRLIYDLSWRQLEEMVAAGWERFGYRVELTPRSRDGGRDVIATRNAGVKIRIFDQVKSRATHRVVTADEVRSLLGTLLIDQNVSKAFITTSSNFAPGVTVDPGIQRFVPYRLELRAEGALLTWLSHARDRRIA